MTDYSNVPATFHYRGKKFVCPCGSDEFKAELGVEPMRAWCECGAMYTEYLVDVMGSEQREVTESGI